MGPHRIEPLYLALCRQNKFHQFSQELSEAFFQGLELKTCSIAIDLLTPNTSCEFSCDIIDGKIHSHSYQKSYREKVLVKTEFYPFELKEQKKKRKKLIFKKIQESLFSTLTQEDLSALDLERLFVKVGFISCMDCQKKHNVFLDANMRSIVGYLL